VAPRDRTSGSQLNLHKLAMLVGGPQLAITTIAAKLRQEEYLREGDEPRTLVADGPLPAAADPLEREVLGSVHRSPGISAEALRRELADSEPVKRVREELTQAGLLVEESAAKRLRRLWIFGGLLAALGIARLIAVWSDGAEIGLLTIVVAAVVLATFKFARTPVLLTARGRAFVRDERRRRPELRSGSSSSDFPYAVALWGGFALWGADPAFASTLGVPREGHRSWSKAGCGGGACASFFGGGDGGGGGGCGGGGCGGGG
jgi:uncharacterized protein (TIGR04222 family)